MFQAYPYNLTRLADGAAIAEFVDLPAATQGDDEELAVHWAPDALHVALTGYVDQNEDLPRPSKPKKGQRLAYLSPLVAMKLEVYQAMRDAGLTRVQLAERMGIDEKMVRRLLDLDHQSKVEQVELALRQLGRALVVDTRHLEDRQPAAREAAKGKVGRTDMSMTDAPATFASAIAEPAAGTTAKAPRKGARA